MPLLGAHERLDNTGIILVNVQPWNRGLWHGAYILETVAYSCLRNYFHAPRLAQGSPGAGGA